MHAIAITKQPHGGSFMTHHSRLGVVVFVGLLMAGGMLAAWGQERPRQPAPPVVSPEVAADRKVTFRIRAAAAKAVRLDGSDIPSLARGGVALTKGDDGVWQAKIGPLEPGAYRYNFDVDGVRVLDPVNPATSESNSN